MSAATIGWLILAGFALALVLGVAAICLSYKPRN